MKTPHYTERVELKEPFEFPCKANYEKINVTIEGLKEKERLDGSPHYLPLPDDDENGNNGDGDDDQDGDGGDGPGSGGGKAVDPSILSEMEKMKEKEQKMSLEELNYLHRLDSKKYTLSRRERTKFTWKFWNITLKVNVVMERSTSMMVVKE